MSINTLISLPDDLIYQIFLEVDFKQLGFLEQTSVKIKNLIFEKDIWWELCKQYGLSNKPDSIKLYISNHSVSNATQLVDKLTAFFGQKHLSNAYFKCLFKNQREIIEFQRELATPVKSPGHPLEEARKKPLDFSKEARSADREQNTEQNKSIIILYTGSCNEKEKAEMKKLITLTISFQKLIHTHDSLKENISFMQ